MIFPRFARLPDAESSMLSYLSIEVSQRKAWKDGKRRVKRVLNVGHIMTRSRLFANLGKFIRGFFGGPKDRQRKEGKIFDWILLRFACRHDSGSSMVPFTMSFESP